MRAARLAAPVFGAVVLACAAIVAATAAEPAHPEARGPGAAEALQRLVDGNARFVAGAPRHDHEQSAWRKELAGGQHPFATVLGCSDSRVPLELVFDQGFGDLFVVRVAGNVVAVDDLGSIAYAVQHLSTPLVLVVGHEACGAVTAALKPAKDLAPEPASLRELLALIAPALKNIDPALPAAERVHRGVEANVRQAVARLREAKDLQGGHAGAVRVEGAVYDLETGRVRLLN